MRIEDIHYALLVILRLKCLEASEDIGKPFRDALEGISQNY